jgi:hypothetical protein
MESRPIKPIERLCEITTLTVLTQDITYKYNIIIRGQIRDTHASVYNNVFYGPVTCLTGWLGAEEFYNNIVYFTSEGQQGAVDYNLYNREQSNMFGNGYDTLATTGQESHSIVADPQFTDAEGYDFTLTASSLAIDNGFYFGESKNYFSNPVGTLPDIGIHEVQ